MVYEDFMPRIGLSLFMEFGVGAGAPVDRPCLRYPHLCADFPGNLPFHAVSHPAAAGAVSAAGQGAYPSCRMKDMPASEKAGFRIRPLCRNIGGMIALCGIVFWTGGVEAFRSGSFVRRMTACLALAGLDAGHIGKADAARAAPYAAPT